MLRRGFKSQCERRAVELRKEFDLPPIAPLIAAHVADKLRVTVWSPDDIANFDPAQLRHLTGDGADEWSGFTLTLRGQSLVMINSAQSERRRNSVLMHELAHIMLGHRLADAVVSDGGHLIPSTYNQDQEDEAAWFGATLLLPRPALLWMRRRGMSDDQGASHFKVSPDLLKWRVRMTGIDYQLGLRPARHSMSL